MLVSIHCVVKDDLGLIEHHLRRLKSSSRASLVQECHRVGGQNPIPATAIWETPRGPYSLGPQQ